MIRSIIERIKRKRLLKILRAKGMTIGDGCEIYPTAAFGSEPYLISIGNKVRINSGVTFVTHDGGVWVLRNLEEKYKDIDRFGRIIVKDNVHIGTNAIIMPGVVIGCNCIVGCGAVVTKSIPDNSIVVGVPARVIKSVFEYASAHECDFDHTKFLPYEQKKKYILKKYSNN